MNIVAIRTFIEENGVTKIKNTVDTSKLTKQEIINLVEQFNNDPSINMVQTKQPIRTTLDCNPTVTYAWFPYPISLQE